MKYFFKKLIIKKINVMENIIEFDRSEEELNYLYLVAKKLKNKNFKNKDQVLEACFGCKKKKVFHIWEDFLFFLIDYYNNKDIYN